jgi:hypothetical protein
MRKQDSKCPRDPEVFLNQKGGYAAFGHHLSNDGGLICGGALEDFMMNFQLVHEKTDASTSAQGEGLLSIAYALLRATCV